MKEMWDKRYSVKEYVYGKSPNKFFKETIDNLGVIGNILLPAEGEGRNAVYAAKRGFSVYANDISYQARNKALQFAEEENVKIEYHLGEITDIKKGNSYFDIAALIFTHFPPHHSKKYHDVIAELIKPGGYIILEGFSKNNLEIREKNPSIGGPNKAELLYSEEDLKNDFKEFNILMLGEVETELNEGIFHRGIGKVVRFIGQKPSDD